MITFGKVCWTAATFLYVLFNFILHETTGNCVRAKVFQFRLRISINVAISATNFKIPDITSTTVGNEIDTNTRLGAGSDYETKIVNSR